MKKAFKIIGIMVGVFILGVIVLLIADISNDVEYTVLKEEKKTDSNYIRVETEATSEEDLRNIVKQVKGANKDIDAVWLWIYEKDSDKLLAKAKIPYNTKGQVMVGANDSEYIFEKE